MKLTTGMLALIVGGVLGVLGMMTFLLYHERSIDDLVQLVLTMLSVAGGAWITVRQAQQAKHAVTAVDEKVTSVEATVTGIEQKVNGRMSELIAIAERAGEDPRRFADLMQHPTPAWSPPETRDKP